MDPIKLQQDLRNNQEDVQNYMRDLRNWTDEIKMKDKKRASQSKTEKATETAQKDKGGGDSKRSVASKTLAATESAEGQRKKMAKASEPSDEVLKLKEAGNECLKNKKYEEAIKHYSAAMKLDPNYHVLPANRGMAYLKLNSFEKAEEDCSKAVALDSSYIKGYLRRGTARFELGKLQPAKEDNEKVLQLEPHNPQAKTCLERIRLEIAKQGRLKTSNTQTNQPVSTDTSTATSKSNAESSQPAEKPAHLRSKKPLKKIPVVQVRNDVELENFIETGCVSSVNNASGCHNNGRQLPPNENEQMQNPMEKMSKPEEKRGSLKSRDGRDATEKLPKLNEPQKANQKAEPATQIVTTLPMALPAAPRSSYEFVRDWKLLRTQGELRGQYLRQIPPSDYGAIFKQALEESTLVEILRVAESLPASEIGSHLRGLSQVQRVDVLVMFMDTEDRKVLLSLVDRCEADGQDMSDVKKRVGV